jgi:hypothetical protein
LDEGHVKSSEDPTSPVHAKEQQIQRHISNIDIGEAIKHKKGPAKCKKDGVKVVTGDNSIVAIVTGGQKNMILSTWRDEEAKLHCEEVHLLADKGTKMISFCLSTGDDSTFTKVLEPLKKVVHPECR